MNVSNQSAEEAPVASTTSLKELALVFLRLGTTAFGGPAAHIAIMEDEFVRRRRWITREQFLDMLGVVNLIPGPNSTEMAIHIGYLRAGWPGLMVAGTCFIVPAMIIVIAIAWAYVRFGSLPQVAGLLYGVKPVVIVIVARALWGLGRTALKTRFLSAVGFLVVAASFLGADPLILLLLAGATASICRGAIQDRPRRLKPIFLMLIFVCSLLALITFSKTLSDSTEVSFSLHALFLYFLKVGSVLYGSGYVLLAFLQTDLVNHWHWLSANQLLDATAVGQITPGPVFTTATFIGYLRGNLPGALIATAGIFLPAFVFIALSGPIVARLRQSPVANAFLDGVNVASLALMAVVTWNLGLAAIVDLTTILLAVAGAILLVYYNINSAWLVLGGAIAGIIVQAI
jgi:chromate transporter